jgi:glycosyltransferase involved in cell wall biosynthesis
VSGDAVFPRLVVVTDVDVSASCRGAGRTLVNLFARWPADRLLIVTMADGQPRRDEHDHRVRDAGGRMRGGIASRLRALAGDVEALWAGVRPLPSATEIARFEPDLLLVVPTTSAALVLGLRFAGSLGCPSVAYFMDAWMQTDVAAWPGGSAERASAAMLQRAAGWMVISRQLEARLRLLAGEPRPALVVHNPVEIGAPPAALSAPREGPYRITYAGSIWPMHFDAIAVVAAAAARLRGRGKDVRLVLHTDRHGWESHAAEWARWGVEFGGLVPFESLRARLGEYDLLLVASSFDARWAPMTRSSLQTKVTDYMAAGRPILSCGPPDGACSTYLREHACAWILDSADAMIAEAALARCVEERAEGRALAARAYDVVCREHEAGAVGARLREFLSAIAAGRAPA